METVDNPARRRLFRGKVHQAQVLRLPWSIEEAAFTQQCSQCQDCLKVCETQIIVRDEQGFPKIDFSKGECSFCQKCIQSCKEPLFVIPKNADEQFIHSFREHTPPWPIKLDISDKCLAKNNIYCQSCRDECETRAITFSFTASGKASSIPQPEINLPDCTQCGACISTCPQNAITTLFQKNKIQSEVKNAS